MNLKILMLFIPFCGSSLLNLNKVDKLNEKTNSAYDYPYEEELVREEFNYRYNGFFEINYFSLSTAGKSNDEIVKPILRINKVSKKSEIKSTIYIYNPILERHVLTYHVSKPGEPVGKSTYYIDVELPVSLLDIKTNFIIKMEVTKNEKENYTFIYPHYISNCSSYTIEENKDYEFFYQIQCNQNKFVVYKEILSLKGFKKDIYKQVSSYYDISNLYLFYKIAPNISDSLKDEYYLDFIDNYGYFNDVFLTGEKENTRRIRLHGYSNDDTKYLTYKFLNMVYVDKQSFMMSNSKKFSLPLQSHNFIYLPRNHYQKYKDLDFSFVIKNFGKSNVKLKYDYVVHFNDKNVDEFYEVSSSKTSTGRETFMYEVEV